MPRPKGTNPCCYDEEGNVRLENMRTEENPENKTWIHRCQVCGCRHFGVSLDPGVLGLKGAPTGLNFGQGMKFFIQREGALIPITAEEFVRLYRERLQKSQESGET